MIKSHCFRSGRVLLFTLVAVSMLHVVVSTPVFSKTLESPKDSNETGVEENQAEFIPQLDILYEDSISPAWKGTWDLARKLYREKKYREACVQYEILLNEKNTVEEARWEYASVLLHLERWVMACEQLEKLLDHDPANQKYMRALAGASLECGNTDKAVALFSELYEKATDDVETRKALEGLVLAQEFRGNQQATLPLLDQLMLLRPDDRDLQIKQARLLVDLGHNDRAAEVLDVLEEDGPADADVLLMKARLLEKTGNAEQAAGYYQKLIALDPDNLAAHRALKRYYAGRKNWAMSLKHLEKVLQYTRDDVALLEEAAELNIRLGRIDGALDYYDYCLVLRPGNTALLKKKKKAQEILARDLLVLVENDGSEKLWQDLVQVTADRPGIYREIAILLRERNMTDELIDVLSLLYREDPGDKKTFQELAHLLEESGRTGELSELQKNKTVQPR